jgi:Protein of unknown function (DUF1697)
VGGHNKIPMRDLAPVATELGYSDVATYIQSGNVWLTSRDTEQQVAVALHDAIAARFTLDIAVIVRPVTELQRLSETNPYLGASVDAGRLYVTFFAQGADETALAAAADRHSPDVMSLQDPGTRRRGSGHDSQLENGGAAGRRGLKSQAAHRWRGKRSALATAVRQRGTTRCGRTPPGQHRPGADPRSWRGTPRRPPTPEHPSP